MSEKKVGIVLGYILIAVEAVCGILFTTVLLNSLGDSEYGLYKLAVSWIAIVSVLDFGLGGTITRYIVKYKTEGDTEGEKKFLGMAFAVYGFLAFAVLVIGAILCIVLPFISKSILPSQAATFRIVFMLLVGKTGVVLFNHAFSGRFAAYERFIYTKSISIVYTIFRLTFIGVMLHFSPSAVTVAWVDLALTFLHLVLNVVMSRRFGFVQARFYGWDGALLREIFAFTSSLFLVSIINQFNSNVDSIVLGFFSTSSVVGLYSSVLQIYMVYCMLSTAIQGVFLPQVSRTVFQKKSDDEITASIIAPSRMQMMILFLALTGFIIFGYDFLRIWLGERYGHELLTTAYLVGCVLMVSSTWQLFQNSATNILKAKNILRGKVMITGISTLVNFAITLLLVPKFGMMGAACGTAFSLIFGYGVATNIYYHVVAKINLKLYYKKTFEKLWYTVPMAFAVGILIGSLGEFSIWSYALKIAVYCAFYAAMMFALGMNKGERESVLNIVRRKKKNK